MLPSLGIPGSATLNGQGWRDSHLQPADFFMLGKGQFSMAGNTSWMCICILVSYKQEQEVVTCLDWFESWRDQKETWVLD